MEAQLGIVEVSFANDVPQNLCLALVEPDTKKRAQLAALEAIATPATIERRDILLCRAAQLISVTSEEDVKLATEIAGLLKGLRNDVEDARKKLKDPVLTIGKAIDGVASEVGGKATDEMERLERLMGNYVAEKERQRQEENRRREQEARRAQEAAEREAQQARENEERLRREVEAMNAKAQTGEVDLLAALDAEARAEEASALAATATAQAEVTVFAPIAPAEQKVTGAAVAKSWDHEVTDIAALYAAKPECVELRERVSVIKAVIKAAAQQAGGKTFTIPGLRISPKVNVTTRAR